MIGRYDASGKLLDVKVGEKVTIAKGGSAVIVLPYDLAEDQTGHKLKGVLWDAETFVPLTADITWNP